jgi:hypothetical protein
MADHSNFAFLLPMDFFALGSFIQWFYSMAFYLTQVLHCPVPGLWVECDKHKTRTRATVLFVWLVFTYNPDCFLSYLLDMVMPAALVTRPWDSAPMPLDGPSSISLRKRALAESYSKVGSVLTGPKLIFPSFKDGPFTPGPQL